MMVSLIACTMGFMGNSSVYTCRYAVVALKLDVIPHACGSTLTGLNPLSGLAAKTDM